MGDDARFETLLRLIDEMRDASLRAPIVVEGRRDVAALRALGIPGDVRPLHDGRSIFLLCESLAGAGVRDVILLTDWDRKGESFHEQLCSGMAANGVRVNVTFRDRIRASVSVELSDVESLAPYVRRGLRKFHRVSLEEHYGEDGHASGVGV